MHTQNERLQQSNMLLPSADSANVKTEISAEPIAVGYSTNIGQDKLPSQRNLHSKGQINTVTFHCKERATILFIAF